MTQRNPQLHRTTPPQTRTPEMMTFSQLTAATTTLRRTATMMILRTPRATTTNTPPTKTPQNQARHPRRTLATTLVKAHRAAQLAVAYHERQGPERQ